MSKSPKVSARSAAAASAGPYTILSARFANAEHTAAVIMTQEAAAVLISEADTPDDWAAMLAGSQPAAYEAPPPPEPADPVGKLTEFLNANPDVKALIS